MNTVPTTIEVNGDVLPNHGSASNKPYFPRGAQVDREIPHDFPVLVEAGSPVEVLSPKALGGAALHDIDTVVSPESETSLAEVQQLEPVAPHIAVEHTLTDAERRAGLAGLERLRTQLPPTYKQV